MLPLREGKKTIYSPETGTCNIAQRVKAVCNKYYVATVTKIGIHVLLTQGQQLFYKVDKKAMIRNPIQSNSTSCPKHQTGKGHGTKIKTTQEKSQGDSSFPTDGHKAILNKLNCKSKTNRTWKKIDN